MRTVLGVLLAIAAAHPGCTVSAPAPRQETPAPAPRLDFSGVDQFWKLVDILSKDAEPTEAQWRALLDTPGYRLVAMNMGDAIRDAVSLTFKPSRRGEFAARAAADDDRAQLLKHLSRAGEQRAALTALRDSLASAAPVAAGMQAAARYLPPGATSLGEPPLVAFAIFADDAFSFPEGIVIDLLNAHGDMLVPVLGHEFHHAYVNRMAKPLPAGSERAPDATLRDALYTMRNEGIADLIDKPFPYTFPSPAMADYSARYNAEYERTPATLSRLDSLLAAATADPSALPDVGARTQRLLWSSGHPNGAYIAREIYQTFGTDSLIPATRNPAAFLRTFAAAEARRGKPSPFSAAAWKAIDELDAKYWRR